MTKVGCSKSSGALVQPLMQLWLSGFALRATILALPPVVSDVTAEFGLSASGIGVLTSLPPLLFALAAVPSAAVIARSGAVSTLVAGLLLNALGAVGRGFASGVFMLDAATFLMCLGVAVMQPALPPLVREWAPTRVGFATAVYTNGLLVGEVIPSAFVPHLTLPAIGGGWRASLAAWAVPVLGIALLVAVLGRRPTIDADAPAPRWWPDWRDPRVWRLGLLLGGVNAAYFGLNGFLPGWLSANGSPTLVQPALVALNLAQIPASLLMLATSERLLRKPMVYIVAGAALLAGVLGVVATPGPFAVGWAALFGFSAAVLLTLALALPAALGDTAEVPRLSAAVFTVSYGFAMVAVLAGGRLSDISGTPALAFLPFVFSASAVTLLGATLKLTSKASSPATDS